MKTTIRWQLLIAVTIAFALVTSANSAEQSKPSLLNDLPRIQPVIACIDTAPVDDTIALEACAAKSQLLLKTSMDEPKSLSDFEGLAVLTWMLVNRAPDRQKNTKFFSKAIDYARCIETSAYADARFSSKTRAAVEAARMHAELTCKDHPLSIRRLDPSGRSLPLHIAPILFGRTLGNLAFNYALEANGWFPDEMRPCIRYLDGRPPSVGCAYEPAMRTPYRPPPPPG